MARRADWNFIRWIPISIVALAISSREAVAQCADERIEPPGAVVHGRTVAGRTADYWQWGPANPLE